MLTILHYDHFSNAKCRKLFLYICFCFIFFIYIFFLFLHFANATCRNAFFSTNFYILPCVIPYCKKTPFQTTPYLKFSWKSIRSENNTLLLSFPDAHANPRNIWVGPLGDTENHYETRFWCAVDFNNLKCISFIKCEFDFGPDQIPAISVHWLWSYLPLSTGRNALDTIAPVFLIGSSSNLQVTRTGIKYWMSLNSSHIHLDDIRLDRIKSRRL